MLKSWKQDFKSHFKVIIIFFSLVLLLFLIDWLTKYFLFDKDSVGPDGSLKLGYNPNSLAKDYKIIGIRSYPHNNTTLFSFLKLSMPVWTRILLNIILITAFIIPIFKIKSKALAMPLAIIVSGMLGNTLDIIFTSRHYVRDIFFTPWLDKGTFNTADVLIVAGAFLLAISILFSAFKSKEDSDNKVSKK